MQRPGSIGCIPQCVEMVKMLTDESKPATVEQITEAIIKDPFLTARVLAVANSAHFNRGGRTVSTVSQAVLMLGLQQIRTIVFSVMVLDKLPDQAKAGLIRNRTVASAFSGSVGRVMAQQIKYAEKEKAFLAGAFSQFGQLLVYSFLPQEAAEFEERKAAGEDSVALSREIFGSDVHDLGREIARLLRVPDALIRYMDMENGAAELTDPNEHFLYGIAKASSVVCGMAEADIDPAQIEDRMKSHEVFQTGPLSHLSFGDLFRESVLAVEALFSSATKAPLFKRLVEVSEQFKTEGAAERARGAQILREAVLTVTGLMGRSDTTMRGVLLAVAEALHLAFDATTTIIAVKTKARTSVRGEVAMGFRGESIYKQVEVSLNERPTLLPAIAMATDRTIYLQNPVQGKFSLSLPTWVSSATPPAILILPLVEEGNRYAFLYLEGELLLADGKMSDDIKQELATLKRFVIWSLIKDGRD
jgi:HD-like signal output (HDOD) protein